MISHLISLHFKMPTVLMFNECKEVDARRASSSDENKLFHDTFDKFDKFDKDNNNECVFCVVRCNRIYSSCC